MNMWELLNDQDHYLDVFHVDCDDECSGPGPPPVFRLPPPPRPPFLQVSSHCTDDPLPDIEICDAMPFVSLTTIAKTDSARRIIFFKDIQVCEIWASGPLYNWSAAKSGCLIHWPSLELNKYKLMDFASFLRRITI